MKTSGKIALGVGTTLLLILLANKKSTAKGIDIIKSFEGFRNKAYQDSVGVWTIGYGTTKNVKPGDMVTQAQAERFLRRDMAEFTDTIKKNVKRKLNNNQFNALLSLVYNIGSGAFKKSTLLKKINEGAGIDEIEPQFLAWRNAGGKPILLGRRKKEFELFKS